MLSRILVAIRTAGRPLCLADLQRELDLDASALEGMLETLVARGRLRTIRFDDAGCGGCPIRSGCFIMADGVAATYALTGDAPVEATPVEVAPASSRSQAARAA
jgi:hypothetical protein